MNEEIVIILKMLEDGKISATKAKELIDALESASKSTTDIVSKKYDDKLLKVEILSSDGDKVNIKLPVSIIKEAIKVTGSFPLSTFIEGMDEINIDKLMNTIVACLDKELIGEIVDISSSNGDTVKIIID